jgi:hypothetical protein
MSTAVQTGSFCSQTSCIASKNVPSLKYVYNCGPHCHDLTAKTLVSKMGPNKGIVADLHCAGDADNDDAALDWATPVELGKHGLR